MLSKFAREMLFFERPATLSSLLSRRSIKIAEILLLLLDPSIQQLFDLVHDHPRWPVSERVAHHPLNQSGTDLFPHDLA